jgi:hypothetical protein
VAIALAVAGGVTGLSCGVASADPAEAADAAQRPDTRQTAVREHSREGQKPLRQRSAHRTIPDRRPLPAAKTLTTSASAPVTARATASANPIAALLANTTPGVRGTQTGQSAEGIVTGLVEVSDPDGDATTIAVVTRPSHGSVVPNGQQYTYTPDPLLAHTGVVDSFAVATSDEAAGFHLHGLAGLINLLTFGLIGSAGHTATTTVRVSVAPFNNAPTATVRIDPPDPVTGVVTGAVIGSDPNGDAMTYSGSTTTDRGQVIVSATGSFTYTPAAVPAASDTFILTVADSYGGVITVPVTVGVTSELSTFCGCTLMPANTVFHADVSDLPVLAQSATWTGLLGGTLRASWGGDPWMGSTGGMPVNIVGATRQTETVIFNRGYTTSGPSIDNTPYAIPDYPLVEGMPDVPAWDRHLLVFQEGTCISQELYNVANGVELPAAGVLDALGNAAYAAAYGSAWIAEAGVHVDMSSPLYPAIGWANASRLPYLPVILRPDDLKRGSIDHMLGISIAKDRGIGYTWPARAGDGTGTNPNGVPMGTVLRLRADFDMSGYDPTTQVVLRALQQHGAVIYDSTSPGQDGAHLLAMSNGWTATRYPTVQRELGTIPLSAFEAVDVLSLALDPDTGWMIG